jgi:Tfp pilus assembly protein PilV
MVSARRSRAANRGGFILVDVIIAGVLLGIGLATIIGLTGSALASQRRGEEMQIAAMLADEQLNLVLAVGPEAFASTFRARGDCPEPFSRYAYAVTIAPRGGSEPSVVTAEISWESGGRDRSIVVQTMIAPRRGTDPDPERKPEEAIERQQ